MGGDEEGKHVTFFPPGLMQRQGSTAGHTYSLPGFPPQIGHLPLPGAYPPPPPPLPGAFTCARPGYAYAHAHAHAHAYAYPPPPPPPPLPAGAPYAYPPQGYPLLGSSAPHQGHGSSGSSGGRRQIEIEVMDQSTTPPKAAGGGTAAAAATASATAAYGAISNLFRGQGGSSSRNAKGFGRYFGRCCGGGHQQHGTSSSFKQLPSAGHGGHQQEGKFNKRGHHAPAKFEHVHGKFRTKRTTWKY